MSSLYPVGLRLAGRKVLVVGGGTVATRRVPALLDAGAEVLIVSPSLTPALRALADAGRVTWVARRFEPSDVDGAWLVQAALDDRMAAAAVSAAAAERKVFCVRADDRAAATAWTPAVTRHGAVTVAVLGGGDPRRAMAVRDGIRDRLADGSLDAGPSHPGAGVALVGAGPGDPELITVRGRRLLALADVVVADRLVPGLLLDELRPDVELVDASKIPYGPAKAQEEINRILVSRARQGRFVVRLKGGDPYVFGRGAEETPTAGAGETKAAPAPPADPRRPALITAPNGLGVGATSLRKQEPRDMAVRSHSDARVVPSRRARAAVTSRSSPPRTRRMRAPAPATSRSTWWVRVLTR